MGTVVFASLYSIRPDHPGEFAAESRISAGYLTMGVITSERPQ
jgi:hypothetical protein